MEIKLLSITPNIEKHIEFCGRNCYQSFDKVTDISYETFIKGIIRAGHESVLEHGYATFFIKGVSRVLMGQITRHRLASFSIKSQRFVNEEDFDFVIPPDIDKLSKNGDSMIWDEYEYNTMKHLKSIYKYLIDNGIKKEDARMVLPNAATTDIVMSANMREWRHILKLRLHKSAQWEIRNVCIKIFEILTKEAPSIFFDFEEI